MKHIIIIAALTLLAGSCTTQPVKVVIEKYPEGQVQLEYYYLIKGQDSSLIKEIGYYQQGQKRIEGTYKENKRDGAWTYWYENGNKWSQAQYQSDLRHGLSTVWHENATKYYEGNYKFGERAGLWKFWDQLGELKKEINYDE